MECLRAVTADVIYLGGNDRRLALFESSFPVPQGMSYNAYLVRDEKTVLLNTVDPAVADVFFTNLEQALAGRPLDYVVVQHMEPDHAGTLNRLLEEHPETKVVMNAKTAAMFGAFFGLLPAERSLLVKEGDVLTTGRHAFSFIMAPMVHWPEVMVVYDAFDKALYSADAFGSFGALSGELFADEADFARDILPESRRYYTNIVGKYGPAVQTLLKKASAYDIRLICPLHSHVYRKNLSDILHVHDLWSRYVPEEKGVLIAYASVYGHTAQAAEAIARDLNAAGIKTTLHDVAVTHPSYLVAEAFRISGIILASATINGGILSSMETFLNELVAHNLQNRVVGLIENGSWAPLAARTMAGLLAPCKGFSFLPTIPSLKSRMSEENREELARLSGEMVASLA